jgi:hypothetical protein
MATTSSGSGAGRTGKASGKPAKVIRDSFTMPAADYERIGVLKQRCIGLGVAIKKSELLRAGLVMLENLPDENLARVAAAVESVKTGRPPGKKKKKKKKRKANRARHKKRSF